MSKSFFLSFFNKSNYLSSGITAYSLPASERRSDWSHGSSGVGKHITEACFRKCSKDDLNTRRMDDDENKVESKQRE